MTIVATWNVNGVRARLVRMLEWLAERKPDVVCLQELKVKEEDFPHEDFRAAGYHAAIVGQQSWNGVGVLARERPETLVRELPGAGAAGARFITVRACGMEVASVYVPNGKTAMHADFAPKLAWLERLAEHIEARADKDAPLVVAGDFNVCPTDLDSYLGAAGRGAIFHTDDERSRLARLPGAGLVDLYRAKYESEPGFSWWDYRAGAFHKRLGMRIDLILATPAIARRAKDVVVDREFRKKSKISKAVPSDHAPVFAVLD
jgi:exodeoxyribonuclease-3